VEDVFALIEQEFFDVLCGNDHGGILLTVRRIPITCLLACLFDGNGIVDKIIA
jgi:hypothetical protein